MKFTIFTRRSFVGLFGITLALSFVPLVSASGPAPEPDQRRFEMSFLEEMIDHHYVAVKMSELCDGRTAHPDLQSMCENIRTAQTAEIATMRSWLQTWYGIDHEPQIDKNAAKQIADLSQLTGTAFEQAYMIMMIEHHSMAAMMAIDCLNQAYHPEMLNMCAMMLASQSDEIVTMRLWLQQWYGITDLGKRAQT